VYTNAGQLALVPPFKRRDVRSDQRFQRLAIVHGAIAIGHAVEI
jgi:hypothetical protein